LQFTRRTRRMSRSRGLPSLAGSGIGRMSRGGGRGNFLTDKLSPAPAWGWAFLPVVLTLVVNRLFNVPGAPAASSNTIFRAVVMTPGFSTTDENFMLLAAER